MVDKLSEALLLSYATHIFAQNADKLESISSPNTLMHLALTPTLKFGNEFNVESAVLIQRKHNCVHCF